MNHPLSALLEKLLSLPQAKQFTDQWVDEDGVQRTTRGTNVFGTLYHQEMATFRQFAGKSTDITIRCDDEEFSGIRLTGKYVGQSRNFFAWISIYK